jgi:hypothetical protein
MPDPFRTQYRELTDAEKLLLTDIKNKASELFVMVTNYYATLPEGPVQRNGALFMTNIEQAVMWAVKGITS